LNDYSTLSANKMYREGKKVGWILIVLKTLLAFIRSYILKLGILDGWPGLTVSVSTSLSVYMKYVKLKELRLFGKKT